MSEQRAKPNKNRQMIVSDDDDAFESVEHSSFSLARFRDDNPHHNHRLPVQETEFLLDALEEIRDFIEVQMLPIGQHLTIEHLETFLERASRI